MPIKQKRGAPKQGFLPCFYHYLFDKYPIDNVYGDNVFIDRIKRLLSCLVEIENPTTLTSQAGIGKEIQAIRPDSLESKRIIKEVGLPFQLYRIDYGDNPFRIIFGIQNSPRIAHIVIIDTNHLTFSEKQKR